MFQDYAAHRGVHSGILHSTTMRDALLLERFDTTCDIGGISSKGKK